MTGAGYRSHKRAQARVVERWNAEHRPGTRVRYWRGVKEGDSSGESVTLSEAQLLGGHTAVVWVLGNSGCIALTHVEVVP